MSVLHRLRNAARRFGVDITRYPAGWSGPQLAQLLCAHRVDVVLDVGANEGEYGAMLRRAGYAGRIVSFEPLAAPGRALARRADADPSWTALPYALGDTSGTTTVNVSGNRGASSSLLPMLDRHSEAAPHARYIGTEEARLRRLDELWPEIVRPGERVFLKLDVQGYEEQVLRGAGDRAAECAGLQVETSFVPLYEGSMLLSDTLDLVVGRLGMTPMAVIPGYVDPRTGQMLQADFVLFRDASEPDRPDASQGAAERAEPAAPADGAAAPGAPA
ncbi:FkbM family methyltransferase [Streptomyces bohaiensis]|uniref:FkbM family methyltransferase n=1 Tax=Streptomyces bohaiensis TaxID=1431344 RepID=A0ABX1CFX8_9ACTN|nr:FkbM family methyltransferase [Streptomyces bohaiensis]NJQ16089.1 FkbM family methyltransferase [Streptomyces bohaiensis]